MKLDNNTVDAQIKLSVKELSSYNSYFLSILTKIKFLLCYNVLIIIALFLFSIMFLMNSKLAGRELFVGVYHLLMLGEVLALYLKRKIKHQMGDVYIESLNVLRQLGDSIEWDKNRRKFRKNPPAEALTAINTFYSIIQSVFFPFRKGLNYYNVISLVNILILLQVLVVSFNMIVAYYL